ncbi:MAG: hypothetical protein CBC05_10390 [Crocinitomicaceae bacterium TMED45]|nr:MAG: hypothetical protein CBC05_10390 [Crocinitomicaceae bacterium TMED45]
MSQNVVAGHGTKFDLKVTENFQLNQAIKWNAFGCSNCALACATCVYTLHFSWASSFWPRAILEGSLQGVHLLHLVQMGLPQLEIQ